METTPRILAKAVTWQVSGFVAMTIIGLAVTGTLEAGGTIALISMLSGFVSYCLHERIWARVAWGRAVAQRPLREVETRQTA
ncbi:MAG: DUF2061 domain-containing protein [Pseudomonadota bacterium]